MLPDVSFDLISKRDFFDPGNDGEEFKDILGTQRGKKRHAEAEAALAFHVDGEQVRTRCHRHPQFPSAQAGVANVRGERGEDSAGDTAVAGFHVPRAEHGVGFVNNHDDRAQRADRHQYPHLLKFRIAHPFGAEFADLHHRQAALAREAIHQERFAHTDPPGDQDAALQNVGLVVFNEPRQFAELGFGRGVRRDAVERDARFRVFETHQALAVFLDQPLLARGDMIDGHARAVAHRLGQQVLRAQEIQSRRARREFGRAEVAPFAQ